MTDDPDDPLSSIFDQHRRISLDLIKGQGYRVVRTPRGRKEPGDYPWDPKNNTKEESAKAIYELERRGSDDNFGIHLFGHVVDIDDDSKNPLVAAALLHFLPKGCNHVWGKESTPIAHHLYEVSDAKGFDPTLFGFLQSLPTTRVAVEMRGGEQRNGIYTLLPGSVHPKNEKYLWYNPVAAKSSPRVVQSSILADAVRYACVAALVAEAWTEGNRNNAAMALSGFLFRIVGVLEDLGTKAPYDFGKEEAKALFEGVLEITDDDEKPMRMAAFHKTWEKAGQGVPVKGGHSLAEMIDPKEPDEILNLLYMLLAGSTGLEELEEFVARYPILNNSSTVIDLQRKGNKFLVPIMSWKETNQHLRFGATTFPNILLASKRAIRVDGIRIAPDRDPVFEEDGVAYANNWRGWRLDPWPEPVSDREMEPFLSYVREILASGNKELWEWILGWLADMFQRPGTKPSTALVLVGKQGVGKSFLGQTILAGIISEHHYSTLASMQALTGTFNSDTAGKLLIQLEEATSSKRKREAAMMKDLITSKWRRVEAKNQDAIQIPDIARYLVTSNDVHEAIDITDDHERRYTIANASPRYRSGAPGAKEFWVMMHAWANNENLSKLHRWFKDYNPPERVIHQPIITAEKRETARRGQVGFERWIQRIVSFDTPFADIKREEDRKRSGFIRNESRGPSDRSVEETADWPEWVSSAKIGDAYQEHMKITRAGKNEELNLQQLRYEFIIRGLMSEKDKPYRTRVHRDEWDEESNGTVKMTYFVTLWRFPTRLQIQTYIQETFGLISEEAEEDTGPGIVISRKPEGPEF